MANKQYKTLETNMLARKRVIGFGQNGKYVKYLNPPERQQEKDTKVKILMIDDHPSQIEGYKVILAYNTSGVQVQTLACYTSENAYKVITASSSSVFDIVFLDRSLPSYEERNIRSGEDLAVLIKKYLPQTKIVILTSHSEAFLLYNIVKKINPTGLLVKSDFTADDLLFAFNAILLGETYYSETVHQSIKELLSKEHYLDSLNRQIITLLAQGVKTKSLPEYMPISLSAIEKRKSHIKDYFGIDKGSDEDIVREARKSGFV